MTPKHLLCLAALLGTPIASLHADPSGHITGFGGVFVKSKNPKALADWYRTVLGIPVQPWGGALLSYDAPNHPAVAVWNAFPQTSSYFAPSTRDFMIDFAVDNLDAFLARLRAHAVPILKQVSDPTGQFAWITDPDGTKIELWQPKPPSPVK